MNYPRIWLSKLQFEITPTIRNCSNLMLVFVLSACSFAPVVSPPQLERLEGVSGAHRLRQGRDRLEDARAKTVAIVYSVNVPRQAQFNQELLSRFDSAGWQFLTQSDLRGDDAKLILSDQLIYTRVNGLIAGKFKRGFIAKNLESAFADGADYVALVDARFAYSFPPGQPNHLVTVDHVSNLSVLFMDSAYVSGPDISINVEWRQATTAAGASANDRDFLNAIKHTRTTMLSRFTEALNGAVK